MKSTFPIPLGTPMPEVEYRRSRGLAISEGHAQIGRQQFCCFRSEIPMVIARIRMEWPLLPAVI